MSTIKSNILINTLNSDNDKFLSYITKKEGEKQEYDRKKTYFQTQIQNLNDLNIQFCSLKQEIQTYKTSLINNFSNQDHDTLIRLLEQKQESLEVRNEKQEILQKIPTLNDIGDLEQLKQRVEDFKTSIKSIVLMQQLKIC